jgi:hypothetical protein
MVRRLALSAIAALAASSVALLLFPTSALADATLGAGTAPPAPTGSMPQSGLFSEYAIQRVQVTSPTSAVVVTTNGLRFPVSPQAARSIEAARRNTVRANNSAVTPNNTIYGNCGYSYLYELPLYTTGPGVYLFTGFDVNFYAFYYSWSATVENFSNGAIGQFRRSGTLAGDTSWQGNQDYRFGHGGYFGRVNPSGSYAIGAFDVCTSAGPYDFVAV